MKSPGIGQSRILVISTTLEVPSKPMVFFCHKSGALCYSIRMLRMTKIEHKDRLRWDYDFDIRSRAKLSATKGLTQAKRAVLTRTAMGSVRRPRVFERRRVCPFLARPNTNKPTYTYDDGNNLTSKITPFQDDSMNGNCASRAWTVGSGAWSELSS